jgi:hypothetical protein
MSTRSNGGIYGPQNRSAATQSSGVWHLYEEQQSVTARNWYGVFPAVPNAPAITNLTINSTSSVSVSFTPGYNGGSAITSYTVIVSPGGATFSAASSPVTCTGLSPNIQYTFSIYATNVVGNSTTNSSQTIYTGYDITYLVVAAGGGGGGDFGGGGGAGGYRTGNLAVAISTLYSASIGAGGAGGTSGSNGVAGANSSFSTITSAGGGYGGGARNAGGTGGSGGGGGAPVPVSTPPILGGAGNTPSTSPSQGNTGGNGIIGTGGIPTNDFPPGGGGGAGAVGGNGSGSTGGSGGVGSSSSITGSSVTYAGGGGAGGYNGAASTPTLAGAGGSGGGGAGNGGSGGTGTNGTVNTGGGAGGGSGGVGAGGVGGSGIVILSVPTVFYSGTYTGSPTITTSGSNTILKFTGNGTYTG